MITGEAGAEKRKRWNKNREALSRWGKYAGGFQEVVFSHTHRAFS